MNRNYITLNVLYVVWQIASFIKKVVHYLHWEKTLSITSYQKSNFIYYLRDTNHLISSLDEVNMISNAIWSASSLLNSYWMQLYKDTEKCWSGYNFENIVGNDKTLLLCLKPVCMVVCPFTWNGIHSDTKIYSFTPTRVEWAIKYSGCGKVGERYTILTIFWQHYDS